MIVYNPKDWFSLIFRFHKSDTFRQLFWLLCCVAIYAWVVAYLEINTWHMRYKTTTAMHSVLGFVISLLLVFRTNTAYDRWWEGRKLWGSLLNNARNIAIKLHVYLAADDHATRARFVKLISDYGYVLKDHLEKKPKPRKRVKEEEIVSMEHKPNKLARELFAEINTLYAQGKISGEQLLVLNNDFTAFTDICGACERIKKTPIPYSYSIFIKKFLFVYIMTMPFGFVSDFGYWIIPVTTVVLYVLVSLELIAEEIEDPFGNDANDLPIGDIADNIQRSTVEILQA